MASLIDTLAGNTQKPVEREQKTPNGVQVIPYDASLHPGNERFLPWLWMRLKEDGLVSLYYPGQEETGFPHFVKMMSGGANILLIVPNNVEGVPDGDPIGFVSWEPLVLGAKNTAVAGFIFLKKFWDSKHSADAANAAMEYWFTKTDLQVVLGVVAENNVLALRFLRRIGWREVGSLPGCHYYAGKECDAKILMMSKDIWEGK